MRSGWFEVFASSTKTSDESTQRDTNSSHEERKRDESLRNRKTDRVNTGKEVEMSV